MEKDNRYTDRGKYVCIVYQSWDYHKEKYQLGSIAEIQGKFLDDGSLPNSGARFAYQ